jgi:hypothetical protein
MRALNRHELERAAQRRCPDAGAAGGEGVEGDGGEGDGDGEGGGRPAAMLQLERQALADEHVVVAACLVLRAGSGLLYDCSFYY